MGINVDQWYLYFVCLLTLVAANGNQCELMSGCRNASHKWASAFQHTMDHRIIATHWLGVSVSLTWLGGHFPLTWLGLWSGRFNHPTPQRQVKDRRKWLH